MTALNHANNDYARRLAEASRTPADHQVPTKAYYHHHNYAKFHFDLGGSRVKTVAFAQHCYITDDKREQDQLDLVADYPGTFIYTVKDGEVAAAMQQERMVEAAKTILATAAANASVHNQMFDPNTPIVPVRVQDNQQTPGLQVTPVPRQQSPAHVQGQGVAVVGLGNSFSGTQAVDPVSAEFTSASNQVRAPNAADVASANIAALAAQIDKVAKST